ncbi:MAG: hypothetical protein ACXIUD_09810 [Mongoliitalea sp.]
MDNFEPIDVEFLINSEEVQRDAARVRQEIEGVGITAEKAEKTVKETVRRVATEQDQILSKLRGTTRTTLRDAMEAFQEMEPSVRVSISQFVRFEAQLQRLRATEKELTNDLRRGTITQGQYNKAMEGIRAESQRTTQSMRELAKEIRNSGKELEAQEVNFNRMDKGVSRVNRNLMAFTYSSAQGFSGLLNNLPNLVDEVIRLDGATKELNAQGQKTPGVMKQIISSVFSWHTLIMAGISLIIAYRKEIWEWVQGLFGVKSAVDDLKKSQEVLNSAFQSSEIKSAVKDVFTLEESIKLAKDGMIDAKIVVDQYNETIGKAAKAAKNLADVEQGMIDNSENYIKATLAKAAADATAEKVATKLLEQAEKRNELEQKLNDAKDNLNKEIQKGNIVLNNRGVTNVDAAKANVGRILGLIREFNQDADKEIGEYRKIFEKFSQEYAGFDLNLNGTSEGSKTDLGKVLSERRTLLDKIAALDAEYMRKSFTKDEEELQALRDKFGKVRELVERFNADPKNKANRIDITGLAETEERAVGDLTYRQETERLKVSLEEQKKLYQEYDRVVADFGIQEAERRFEGQLEIGRKYVDLLREEHDKLASIPTEQLSGPQSERLVLLQQQLRKEEELQRKQMDALLKSLQGYDAERQLMIEKHLLTIEELRKGGHETQIAEETQRHQEEINALDIAQIKKMEIFQDFFNRVDIMSTKNAKKLIDDIRKTIIGLREQYPNLAKFFDELDAQLIKTENKVADRLPQDVMQLAQGFRQMAQEVSGANEGLGRMLGLLSDNLARVSEIQRGMAAFSSARQTGDGFGAVVAGAGVAGAVIGGIIQLNSLIIQANQRQADMLKKQLDFQRQLFFGELEINRLVRERSLEQSKIEGNTLASLIAQREALQKNYAQIREDIEGIESIFGRNINRLDLEQLSLYDIRTKQFKSEFEKKMAELGQSLFVEGTKTVRGGFLGLGRKEVEVFGSLAGKSFEDIEKLFAKGQLTAEAEKLFIELRNLKNEGIEVEKALRDIENQMKSILTGGATASSIADSIIQGFREGRRAVEDFAGDVEELLRRAILSGFKYRFLEAPLNELLDQLYKDAQSDEGLSPEEIERFTQAYNNITQSALDALKELEAATGTSLSNPLSTGNRQGIQGGITRLTEETGQELAGLFRGFFDITKRTFQLSEQRFGLEQRHYETSVQMLLTQGRIEANTAMTVEKLETAVIELKLIAKNTKGGQSAWDMGYGSG